MLRKRNTKWTRFIAWLIGYMSSLVRGMNNLASKEIMLSIPTAQIVSPKWITKAHESDMCESSKY
jgi:hypothetical protein